MAQSRRPRDYAADLRRFLANPPETRQARGQLAYLRRMARQQEKLGAGFTPQRARGHRPAEHRNPRRAEGRRRYAEARKEATDDAWFFERLIHMHESRIVEAEERWRDISIDRRHRVRLAFNYAQRNRGKHDWEWYKDNYELDGFSNPMTEDLLIFGYK